SGDFLAAPFRDLLGQAIGHRLGDHRLAASGRAVEQYALRRAELVLLVVVGVEVGQLYRILDRFDLQAQAADVAIPDVGHLFEPQFFGLALRHALQQVSGSRIYEDVIARHQPDRAERVADDPDLLVIR